MLYYELGVEVRAIYGLWISDWVSQCYSSWLELQGPQVQFLLQPYIFVAFVCSFILFDYTGFYFTHFLLIFHQMHVIPFSEELFESLYRKKFQKNILFLSWDADMIYILVKGKIKLLKSNLKFWEHFSQFFKIIIIVNSFLSQWKIPVDFLGWVWVISCKVVVLGALGC